MRVRYKDRELTCTPFKSLPMPPAAEDEKTIDARIDAILGSSPRTGAWPGDRAQQGAAPPGLHGCRLRRASYSAMEGARRPPLPTPTKPSG